MTTAVETLEVWNSSKLVALVADSSKEVWRTRWIPELVRRRVLVKRGKSWLGRRSQIETALLECA